jgi:hypothetical protein
MATSPIYGWLEPDNSDLVKNGALAIRTLGNAIDTTMATMTPKSIVDAKGDLIAASAADTPARLAVGANDLVLSAASGEATGLKYAGAWTSYTPTWTNLTVGNGTLVARYCQVGKVVTVMIRLTFGSTTAVTGGYVQVGAPVTSAVSAGALGNAYMLDNGVADYPGLVKQDGTTAFAIQPINAAGTYAALGNLTATTPFTWGSGDILNVYFNYEAA